MSAGPLRITIGIDPGQTGAIAVLGNGALVAVHDMPTMPRPAGGHEVNADELGRILRIYMRSDRGADFLVALEHVQAITRRDPKTGKPVQQGANSNFRFGESFGVVRGCVGCLKLPRVLVRPQKWKKHHGLIGKEKDASRSAALNRFPSAGPMLTRKKDGGRAEAMLMADWAYTTQHAPGVF